METITGLYEFTEHVSLIPTRDWTASHFVLVASKRVPCELQQKVDRAYEVP